MALRRRRRGGQGLGDAVAPSLTSLMDVVTIILVYFVKTFAVSPLSVQDPSTQLPISTSMEAAEDTVVVMLTGSERRETGPNGEKIMVGEVPTIVVDDTVILQLNENYEVPAGQLDGAYVISALRQKLLEVKKMQGVTAELTESGGLSGKITLVVDKKAPWSILSKLLVTASAAGFPEFKFAIVKNEG